MKRHHIDPVTAVAAANAAAGIVNTIASLFGGQQGPPRTLGQASQEVRDWFADTGGSQFAQFITESKPEAFAWTVDEILPLFWAWLFTSGRSIGWWTRGGVNMAALRDPRAYRPGLTEDAYAAMGINYQASAENWASGTQWGPNVGGRWPGWVMLPGGGTPTVPTVGATAAQEDPVSTAVTSAALEDTRSAQISTGGLLVVGALVLVAVLLNK